MLIPFAYADTPIQIINSAKPAGINFTPNSNIADLLMGGGSFNILTLVFIFIGLYFMFNIISAGYGYVMSNGDPKKISSASSQFMNGFMGLGIAFFAFVIVNLVTNMLGLGNLL